MAENGKSVRRLAAWYDMVRRSRFETKLEILKNSKEMIKPTHLMYATRLAWQPLQSCLEELKTNQLIEEIPMGEGELKRDARTKVMYLTTAEGIHTLNAMKKVTKSIE